MGCHKRKKFQKVPVISYAYRKQREVTLTVSMSKSSAPHSWTLLFFLPRLELHGGLITIWNSSLFDCSTVEVNSYAISLKFTSKIDGKSFLLSNIYGPSQSSKKMAFITWLYNFNTLAYAYWILAGEFNLYKYVQNRNKVGGDPSEMQIFNDLIWTRILLTFSSVAKASPGVIYKKNHYSLPDFA